MVYFTCRYPHRDTDPEAGYPSPLRAGDERYAKRPDRVQSGRSQRSSDGRTSRPGPRSRYREEMSPISERAYEDPEAEYYRRYKSPVRSRTMDELDMRDLNQTSVPYDSTVHTHPNKSPNIAPPNAVSTPYRSHQQPVAPENYNSLSHQPTQYTSQTQRPEMYADRSHQPVPYSGQSQQVYVPQQPLAHPQQVTAPPPVYQTPGVASLPLQQPVPMYGTTMTPGKRQ